MTGLCLKHYCTDMEELSRALAVSLYFARPCWFPRGPSLTQRSDAAMLWTGARRQSTNKKTKMKLIQIAVEWPDENDLRRDNKLKLK